MFTFKSPANNRTVWKLCFRDRKEMDKIFYEGRTPDDGTRIHGITEYISSTVYIDKDIDGYLLAKTLRHELTHIYLWETGQQSRVLNEEETCDLLSVASPLICKCADDIIFRLKEATYKNGE